MSTTLTGRHVRTDACTPATCEIEHAMSADALLADRHLAPYSIHPAEPRSQSMTGAADNLHAALEAAWQLNRHTEAPTVVKDHRDDPAGRVVATVSVEWAE